jgi:broad specificity phosphatase PhoE
VTTIYLLRHGDLGGDAAGRFIGGGTDLPLSGEGERQAAALAEALAVRDLGAIHCSDLMRSRRTAEILAGRHGIPIVERPELREVAMGQWEGCLRRDIAARCPDDYAARGRDIEYYRVPGGESFADCRDRVLAAWQAILAGSSGEVAVVGHAGVNRLLLCELLGMPAANLFRIGQDYGCMNVIETEGATAGVRLMNCVPSPSLAGRRPCLAPTDNKKPGQRPGLQ